jgi:hypothetical protein
VGRATEKDGQMFSYEALTSGQTFVGSIFGKEEDIQVLAALAAGQSTLRIGRSRTAQYGRVSLLAANNYHIGNALTLRRGDLFRMVAVTPVILEDGSGVNTMDLRLIPTLLGEDLEIVRYSCTETIAAGYNGKWLLPKRGQRALGEGSTIVMRYQGDGVTLNLGFIGLRSGEGYGQIRLEPLPQDRILHVASKEDDAATNILQKSATKEVYDNGLSLLTEVKKLRMRKKAISLGISYGEKLGRPPQNSLLQRISTALADADSSADSGNSQDRFHAFVKNLFDIAQPEQKTAALAFATGQNQNYFKTDQKHLDADHIMNLITSIDSLKAINSEEPYDFHAYQNYLTAAIQRVKTNRRRKNPEKNEKCRYARENNARADENHGINMKGGDPNADSE